jgi:NADPH2:quinone reductase
MKAAFIERTGGPEEIRFADLPEPPVGQRDVFVRVAAVTVDPIDTYIRQGTYKPELPPFPFIIGRDMTGVVEGVGASVSRFKAGDRVWCNNQGYDGRQGTFSQYVSVNEDYLYLLPVGADLKNSVAVFHSALTAITGLARAQLVAGETIFINGAAGGVGNAVLQLAHQIGAKIIATAGSADKIEWCRQSIGIAETMCCSPAVTLLNYKTDNVQQRVLELVPDGVNVHWDTSGKLDIDKALDMVSRRGRMLIMAGLNNESAFRLGKLYTRNCTLYGFTITDLTVGELESAAVSINDYLDKGVLTAMIHDELPLSEAARAHQIIEGSSVFGKIILTPP